MVQKAKDIVYDECIQEILKEFVIIVVEKYRLVKDKSEAFIVGDEMNKAVISRLSEWVSNLTGSTEKAIASVETNGSKIESIIDEYVSFSNKMQGRASPSEADKIIQEQLNKIAYDHSRFFKKE